MLEVKINDLIGIPMNQKFLDSFCDTVGIAAAIVDLEGNIVISSRWQKMCTDFHRVNERSSRRCFESDTCLANNLKEGEKYSLYRCRNGLCDAASPIIVNGHHIANAFVGQFLLSPPDIDIFKRQALKYGFDEKAYLQALSQVPIIDQEKVPLVANFLVSYAEILTGMVLEHKKQLSSEKKLLEAKQEVAYRNTVTQIVETDRNRLLSILDGIDDVIYVADPETYELLHVNEVFKSSWGEDVIGKKCYKINQNRDDPCPFCTNSLIFGEYLGRSYVWEIQNKVNGRWYRCSDKAIRWIDGRMVRFEIAADITKEKLLESELKESNKQLECSNKELEQFAYVASHDLQEPLRMVACYTELLEERYREKLDQKADKYIGYAVEGAKRMQQLINDLLMLSRVNTGGKPFEPIDCNKLVNKVLHGLKSTINDNKAEIEVDPLPTVMADEMQLYQLFQNLIVNAVKFHGAKDPAVKISAKNKNSQWIFSIQDNGIGIDPTFSDRIFVIFQRLHDRGTYQGTGIGLAISKKIIERHGGKIWVESEPGSGSTFYFTIKDSTTHGKTEK